MTGVGTRDAIAGWDHVEIRYGRQVAVAEATLDVVPGEVTALVGGDGAGKTSLLRALAGRVAPTSGTVHRPADEDTGVLAAGPPGYDDLTVAENLAFVAEVRGLPSDRAGERTASLLGAVGLTEASDRLASRLSGGMRRKLGFALATLHRPRLLLLDEPTTGIDPVSRTELWRLIAREARDGTAVVLSTTYLDEAERCAQVLVLDRGDVLADGSAGDIVAGTGGRVWQSQVPGPPARSWRRGAGWRVWAPDGTAPTDGASPVDPDLEDAVVVALLRRQRPDAAGSVAGESGSATTGRHAAGAGSSAADRGEGPATASDVASSHERSPQPDGAPEVGPGRGGARPESGGGTLVQTSGVVRRFGDATAVDEVDLAVHRGEVVGLLGANGAGKTTLVRLLLGLLGPSEGDLVVLGATPTKRMHRRMGYLPQGLGLYPDLTVDEQLRFTRSVYDRGRRRDRDPAHPRLAADRTRGGAGEPQADHDPIVDRRRLVGALPLGAQRLVAFEVATGHDPELVLLDEPTSGVDPLGRARLWDRIRALAEHGAGVLVSTHYMSEAEQCDRLVVMAAGRVVAAGTPAEVVGDRTAVTVTCDDWQRAFAVLEDAGLGVALAGRRLRVVDATRQEVRRVLAAADVDADLAEAPATLEEVFVALATGGDATDHPAAADHDGPHGRGRGAPTTDRHPA